MSDIHRDVESEQQIVEPPLRSPENDDGTDGEDVAVERPGQSSVADLQAAPPWETPPAGQSP